jgi:hypothetical protein
MAARVAKCSRYFPSFLALGPILLIAPGLKVGLAAACQEHLPGGLEIGAPWSKVSAVPLVHSPGREPG